MSITGMYYNIFEKLYKIRQISLLNLKFETN